MNKQLSKQNWPENAPDYNSPEGWQFEKDAEHQRLKNEVRKPRQSIIKQIRPAFIAVIGEGEGTDKQKMIVYFAILIPSLFLLLITYIIKISIFTQL
jgi:hypothetical protein